MKFAINKEHRIFFEKYGWIEFEDLLSNEQLALANRAVDQVLTARLNVCPEELHLSSNEKFYLQGRDLWRSNAFLHRLTTQMRFVEIGAELIKKKPLRLGYDQLFPACYQMPFFQETSTSYSRFLEQISSLEKVSCLQGIAYGLLFALGGKEKIKSESEIPLEGIDIFPSQPGYAIFFQPHILVNWSHLYKHLGQRFYLVVYTFAAAHYYLQPKDPHTHLLKRLGYIFNDQLNDKLNPIVYW